jgi:hypothetical protein
MKLVNSWTSTRKQKDKFEFTLRIGKLTVFEISMDISSKTTKLIFLNIGMQS